MKKLTFTLKYFIFIITLFFTSSFAFGQITSAASGNWNDTGTWLGGIVPTGTDNVVIAGTHTVTLTANAACNNLAINVSGSLQLGANTLNISGDLTNNGIFTPNTGTAVFNGNAPQSVGGTANTNFFNLQINQSALSTLMLNRPTTVTNGLILTNGIIVLTNGNDLTVTSTGTSAISGYSSTSYVRTKTGANTANLVRTNLGVTPTTYYFPVGTDTEGYNLFAFSYGATPPAGNHSVKAITASTFPPFTPSGNTKVVWEVLKPVGTNTNVFIDWQIPSNISGTLNASSPLVRSDDGGASWTSTGINYSGSGTTITNGGGPFFAGSASPVRFAVINNALPTQPFGNRGLYFDGIDDNLVVPPSGSINFAGNQPHTISMWVKPSKLDVIMLVKSANVPIAGKLQILVQIMADGRLSFQHDIGGPGWDRRETQNPVVEVNKWVHLAFTSNGLADGKSIYVNGVSQALVLGPGAPNAFISATASDGNFNLGASSFSGQIDEVRLYNGLAQNATQIQTDMTTTTPNGAAAYWNFDQSTGQTVTDIAGSNNGTLGSNGTVEASDPLWALRVTDNTDNGSVGLGSLRQAITEANLDIDKDYIDFSISTAAPWVISPATNLPNITRAVVIDGTSQFGWNATTNNGLVKVDGINILSSSTGLNINNTATDTEIYGLELSNFRSAGSTASIAINNATNVRIGATNKPNVINNMGSINGITVQASSSNLIIENNRIGTNVTGTAVLGPNLNVGILNLSNGTVIRNNLISGMAGASSRGIVSQTSSAIIQGNKLGTDLAGTGSIPNDQNILLLGNNSTIGGTGVGEANLIANANSHGIIVAAGAIGNKISGNSIYNNANAITLQPGAPTGNNGKVAPTISSATPTLVSGTCESGDVVEVFSDNPQFGATNQGRTFLGTAVTVGTSWTFSGTFTNGDRITATATNGGNNTSSFSTAFVVSAGIPTQPLGNRGMWFDGVDDRLTAPIPTTATDNVTIEAWVKLQRIPTSLVAVIVHSGNTSLNGYGMLVGNNRKFFILRGNVGSVLETDYFLTLNQWTHLTFVREAGVNKAYVNGNLVTITNNDGNAPNAPSGILSIGANDIGTEAFPGQIDEVRVFNTVRTPAQIQNDMGTQTANGALAYWNFDQSIGTTANDISGNGNNGTLPVAPNNPLWALRVTDNTDNGGVGLGSLRQAITEANLDTDTDYIDFSIQEANASTVSTIALTSILPDMSQSVVLDGYSAFGSSPNTNAFGVGNNAQIRVEINAAGIGSGANPPNHAALTLNSASNSTIKGFSIYGVPNNSGSQFAVRFNGTTTNSRVEGCYVGLRTDGSTPATNMNGVEMAGTAGGNILGWSGTINPAAFNIISNSAFIGIVTASNNNIIQGNYIGTDITGTLARPNSQRGMALGNAGTGNQVLNNLISGNGFLGGVYIQWGANGTIVRGNWIGTRVGGTGPLPNTGNGVTVTGNVLIAVNESEIGGSGAGQANIIANNTGFGVQIENGSFGATGNRISRNSIFDNTGGGISLTGGANGNKPAPAITAATPALISGTCQSGDVVEVFQDNPQFGATDQGRTFLGQAIVVGTNWTLSGVFTNGDRITATATSNGAPFNTSPFATAFVVSAGIPTQPLGNRGMYFDGANDYVEAPHSAPLAFAGSSPYTIEAWVKCSQYGTIFSKLAGGADRLAIYVYTETDGRIAFANDRANTGFGGVTTTNSIALNKWTHITVTSSGSVGGRLIYINGVLQSTTQGGVPEATVLGAAPSTGVIRFGANFTPASFIGGQMDEVRMFNTVRTQAEIQTDMATQTPNGALAYWNFEDDATAGVQTSATDIAGGNNGTLQNGALWALRVTDDTDNGGVGLGSLRQVITEANTDADTDYIDFSIDNTTPTTRTISPTSSLTINQRVVLDGYTALGATTNSANLTAPNNAVLRIELDFSGLPASSHGIVLDGTSNGSLVRGLSIYGVPTLGGSLRGINVQGTGGGNRIEGCYVGLRADGTPAANKNMNGIGLDGIGGNIVGWNGTLRTEAFNIISNSNFNGIPIGSNNNIIQGNFIGLQRDGTAAGNSERGFLVNQAGNQILNNVISGNGTVGVDIRDNASNTQVRGNRIGTNLAGTAGIPNGSFGVQAFNNSNNNIIGGIGLGQGNTIAFNGDFGVNIDDNSSANTIVRNNIFENNNGGIALCAGCNGNKPVPVIASAATNTISGTCQNGDIVEIFNDTPDFSSTNQGRVYLGTATTVGTNWTFPGTFTIGDRITATATSGAMPFNTSPFSLASIVVQAPPVITSFTPTNGIVGTSITINGSGFNPDVTGNTVYFGAVSATITNATATQLTVNAPAGATSVTPITVRNNLTGLQASSMETITGTNARQFTVTNTPNLVVNTASYVRTDFAVGTNPRSVVIEDFNGDNIADIATANGGTDDVSVLIGTGAGSFGTATNFPTTGSNSSFVASGDFNKDGNIDLAVTNYLSNDVSILIGTGTGSFGAATIFAVGMQPISVAVGDFNADGNLDLATTNFVSNDVSILIGTGTGSFGAATNFAVGNNPRQLMVGDFNADGKADLATANTGSANVSILLGTGAGSFGGATNFAVGSNPYTVAVGDFNGDDVLDLAAANFASNNVSVLIGTGGGNFGTATNFAVGTQPISVAVGDLNGDGALDLSVTNFASDNVSMLLGTGTGSFGTPTNIAVGTGPNTVAVADFNGDSKADMLAINRNSNNITILLYTTPPPVALATTNVTTAGFFANWQSSGSPTYDIEYSTSPTLATPTLIAGVGGTSAAVNVPTSGVTYYYRIKNAGSPTGSNIRAVVIPPAPGSFRALQLNGTNQYVDIGASPSLDLTNNLTIEAWIKPNSITGTQRIFTKDLASSNTGFGFGLFNNQLIFTGYGVIDSYSTGTVSVGVWNHIAVTFDNIGNGIFYINGVQSGTFTLSINPHVGNIGRIGSADGGEVFNGDIDELRIWNTAQSLGNIRDNMCKKLIGNEANLLSYFRFDEASGNITENKAQNSTLDGTLVNAPTQVFSGAAVGDVSAYRYTSPGTAGLADFSAFFGTGGAGQGVQVYKVFETPNSVIVNPSLINTLEPSQYFGVFGIGLAANAINVNYNYTGNVNIDGVALEPRAKLYSRLNGAGLTWAGVPSLANTVSNVINAPNQNTGEFIAGFRNFVSANPPGSGEALRFNGTNQYVEVPDNNELDLLGNEFTISAWIKVNAYPATASTIVSKRNNAGDGYALQVLPSGEIRLTVTGGTTINVSTIGTPVPIGQWAHLHGTFQGGGTSTASIEVNGTGGGAIGGGFPVILPNSTEPLLIGAENVSSNITNYFNGEIDEVRIWKVQRTQAQERNNMCQKLFGTNPNLVGYYRFDEGTGSATEDRSTNLNDGTLVNNPTWVIHSGAPIGDVSAAQYDVGTNVGVADTDLFSASFIMTPLVAGQGVHVYKVREAPNSIALPLGFTALETSRYFGVFKVNAPDVDITYKYDANANIAGTPQEFLSAFSERDNNADLTWSSPLLITGYGLTPPNNKFMSPPNPITAIHSEFMIGFTSSVPNVQASNIQFTSVTSNSISLSWTNGNGQNRIVVANTSAIFTPPANFTTYTVGQMLGTGIVIYNGSGSAITYNGLTSETQYYFHVFEYNGTGMTTIYNIGGGTNNPNTISTLSIAPQNQPTGLTFANITTTTALVSFTASVPPAAGYVAVIRKPTDMPIPPADGTEYPINTQFFNGQVVVFSGATTSFSLLGLAPSTSYVIDIYAFNGSGATATYNKINPLSGEFKTLAPVPQLVAIEPNNGVVGGKSFVLQAKGVGFVNETKLLWAGQTLETTFINATTLSAVIADARLLVSGSYPITVQNPAPGGGISNALPFTLSPLVTIKSIPVISEIVPPDKDNHLLYRLEFFSGGGETVLKSLKYTTSGSYQTNDLKPLAFSLYLSNDEGFDASDILLLTSVAIPTGNSFIFDLSRLSPKIILPRNTLRYLLLTVNIAKDAKTGNEIKINSMPFEHIEFEGLVIKQGKDPADEGVIQKIASSTPAPQDYSALVKFFNDMGGEKWTIPWNLNNPVNTWQGVELDALGNVIALSLPNNNLEGQLSNAVMVDGVLISQSLRYMNLSGNKIQGQIPSQIGNLTNLEYLDLSKNQLTGNLSNDIAKLTKLTTLLLSNNQLSGLNLDFAKLSNLKNLFLQNNNLDNLPNNIAELVNLEVLNLEGNRLQNLPDNIGKLSKLEYLDISNNRLQQVPATIISLNELEGLLMHTNQIKSLPNGMINLAKLNFFTTYDNLLEFGSLEPLKSWWTLGGRNINVIYAPQGKVGKPEEISAPIGSPLSLKIETSGTSNIYQWFKNGMPVEGAKSNTLSFPRIGTENVGTYVLQISNTSVPNLILQSHDIVVTVDCGQVQASRKPVITVEGASIFCGVEPLNSRLITPENAEITSFQWFFNGIQINNTNRNNILARDAGKYRVQIITKDGCSLFSDEITITVLPEYTVNITQNQLVLQASVVGREISNYEWFLGDIIIQGATQATYAPVEVGAYKVRVTDRNGCRSISTAIMVNVVSAEEKVYSGEISVYPNPSSDVFYVEVGKEKVSKIQIFNALGKYFNEKIVLIRPQVYKVDLEFQALGLYFVEITTNKGKIIRKLIKE
jgi:Leucine-rich repeat (LRR) protein/Ca2+-binding EF-hand superfamily protein